MDFEFDPAKSPANLEKHGIDFIRAQAVWSEHAMKKTQRTSRTKALSAADLDAMHDAGIDLSAHVDLGKAVRPGRSVQRVNVDFPLDLVREIDQEARRLGVTRQAFIKVRLADSLVKSH